MLFISRFFSTIESFSVVGVIVGYRKRARFFGEIALIFLEFNATEQTKPFASWFTSTPRQDSKYSKQCGVYEVPSERQIERKKRANHFVHKQRLVHNGAFSLYDVFLLLAGYMENDLLCKSN